MSLLTTSFKAYCLEVWVITKGNAELPFLIRSESSSNGEKFCLYAHSGELLYRLKHVVIIAASNSVYVTFEDGDQVEYQIYNAHDETKITKGLIVDENNRVLVLIKRQSGLSRPTWQLFCYDSDTPIAVFSDVNIDYSTGEVNATQFNGIVAHYYIAPSNVLPDLNRPPDATGLYGSQ